MISTYTIEARAPSKRVKKKKSLKGEMRAKTTRADLLWNVRAIKRRRKKNWEKRKTSAEHIKITTALTNKHWCFSRLYSLSIAIVVFFELIFATGVYAVSHFEIHNIHMDFNGKWMACFFPENFSILKQYAGWLICWARTSHMYFDPKSSNIHRPYRIAFAVALSRSSSFLCLLSITFRFVPFFLSSLFSFTLL